MTESPRMQSDEELAADSRVEAFRGPGPGGQKRNKTSSAVRVTHIPTGISATASESRSQSRNKKAAIWRVRHKIALKVREKLDLTQLSEPGIVKVSRRSVGYAAAIGKAIDVLDHARWSVSDAARLLGVSTGQLVSFLRADAAAWEMVNRQRQKLSLRTLNA